MKILVIGRDLHTSLFRRMLKQEGCEAEFLSFQSFAAMPQEERLTADAAIVGNDHGAYETLTNGSCLADIPFVAAVGAENIAAGISTLTPEENRDCNAYLGYGGEKNLRGLIAMIRCRLYGGEKPEAPQKVPFDGIYTPNGDLCEDVTEYLSRYEVGYDTYVGIINYRTRWQAGDMKAELTLKNALNKRGIGVILVFSAANPDTELQALTMDQAAEKFFMENGRILIDAMVNFLYFPVTEEKGDSLYDRAAAFYGRWNLPVLHPTQSYHHTNQSWMEEKAPFQYDTAMCFDTAEMQGMIEPLFLGGMGEQELHDVVEERAEKIAARICGWITLRKKKNSEKKLAVMMNNAVCSGVEATLGKASGLASFDSVIKLLQRLKKEGYQVGEIPKSGEALRKLFLEKKAYSDFRWTAAEDIVAGGGALYQMRAEEYAQFFDGLPEKTREKVEEAWGTLPGEAMVMDQKLLITGLQFGNVLLMIQPKRGCYGAKCTGEVCKILQDPSCPPTHQYLATYYYAAEVFGADAWIHFGTHGSAEFLPGKASGLSAECYPDIVVGNKPNLYVYNPRMIASAMLAKRRTYAVIVDHKPLREELHTLEEQELDALILGLNGGFVQPGAGGEEEDAPETGRNLYGIQMDRIPTREAYERGSAGAEAMAERYLQEEGRYPKQVVLNMISLDIPRTKGEQISVFLHLLGVRPCWNERGVVCGMELIPLKELKRPRIDVSAHISGVLRDTWPSVFALLDEAVKLAADAKEDPEQNFVIQNLQEAVTNGEKPEISRIFGAAPGVYASGIGLALKASAWKNEEDLGRYFIDSSCYAYGKDKYGKKEIAAFLDGVKRTEMTCDVVSNQTDALACSYSSRVQGGYDLAAKALGLKKKIRSFMGESGKTGIAVKTLNEYVTDGVKQTFLNEEWKKKRMQEGYEGAAEIMRRLQHVFEIQCVNESFTDEILDQVAEEYLNDEKMQQFMEENNPYAGEEAIRRFAEMRSRGKWTGDPEVWNRVQKSYLKAEGALEDGICGNGEMQAGNVEIVTADGVEAWKARLAEVDQAMKDWKK